MTRAGIGSIDSAVHGPVRLGVLTALQADGDLDFTTLRKRLQVADGALGAHLKKLEAVGYVSTKKAFVGRRPKTTYRLTVTGSKALFAYGQQMSELLRGVSQGPAAKSLSDIEHLGDIEHLVMLAILRLGESAHGVEVGQELDQRTGRSVSRGTLYKIYDTLEELGLLSFEMVAGDAERGGRRRRLLRLTPKGLQTVRASREQLLSMWEGLTPVMARSGA